VFLVGRLFDFACPDRGGSLPPGVPNVFYARAATIARDLVEAGAPTLYSAVHKKSRGGRPRGLCIGEAPERRPDDLALYPIRRHSRISEFLPRESSVDLLGQVN
jgi:hypothetical protein